MSRRQSRRRSYGRRQHEVAERRTRDAPRWSGDESGDHDAAERGGSGLNRADRYQSYGFERDFAP